MTAYKNLLTPFVGALCVLLSSVPVSGMPKNAPPPNLGRPYEGFTNKTMDELITGSLGNVDVASNLILSDDGKILAELDMYLTQDQFLSMYQPPSPEAMEAMGIGPPSPMGVDRPSKYMLFDDQEGGGYRAKRKAIRETRLRWTNNEVPYLFANGHFSEKEEYLMRRAMTEWERYTCLNFKPANSDHKNSVRFQNGVGCNSQLGMVGGIQVLNLQAPGCRYKGLYLHEIGHAVGLVHEHQLPNRDNYIDILYHNVAHHMKIWFNKYSTQEVYQMNVPYEYTSVMHYGITAFARDGKSQTIKAKRRADEETIGRVYLKELSYTDVQIVNLMYNCSSHCPDQSKCGPDGHVDQNCNCICRDGSQDCDSTRAAARSDASCRNNYDSWACYDWANQGECERNSLYMHEHCRKACGLCGSNPKTSEKNNFILWPWQWLPVFAKMLPREMMVIGNCKDVFKQKCLVWKERGDCVTNQRWMKENCPATCGLCGNVDNRPEVSCSNNHENDKKCEEWARDGECAVNPQWMFDNCRKACALCNEDEVVVDETGTGVDEDKMECEDTNSDCQRWSEVGECESNPSWMIPNCRKACKKCDDGTCKNLYDDVQCKIWAQKFECMSNNQWMSRHCAKSCGRGLCEGVDPTLTTPTTTTRGTGTTRSVTTAATCENKHSSDTECDIWAKNNHCDINPEWMLTFCAKSCRQCVDKGGVKTTDRTTGVTDNGSGTRTNLCHDDNENCPLWAKEGHCDTNPRYSLVFCKKACMNCNGCRDTEFLCPVWAKDGYCVKNPRYMLRHCQKSCNGCEMSDELRKFEPGNHAIAMETSALILMTSLLLNLISRGL